MNELMRLHFTVLVSIIIIAGNLPIYFITTTNKDWSYSPNVLPPDSMVFFTYPSVRAFVFPV